MPLEHLLMVEPQSAHFTSPDSRWALIEKIEIGEKHPDTGQQEVKVFWKF